MKLSVSCPNCGKQFRNIKPEMAGKKARCGCGTVVRLGTSGQQPVSHREPEIQKSVDLLDVDLLGDEMLGDQLLGDQLLGGDLNAPDPAPAVPTPSPVSTPQRKTSAPARPAKTKIKPAAKITQKEPALDPSHKNSKRKNSSGTKPRKKESVPEIRLMVSVSKSEKNRSGQQRPMFEQTYGDLDEILSGAGDASPLIARPRPGVVSQRPSTGGAAEQGTETTQRNKATPGFLAALGSATLAFWFGLFVVGSRFEIINWFLLSGFSTHLNSVFTGTFGDSQVPSGFQIMFAILGWLLWCVAVAMVVIAIGQFINAFTKLLADRQPLGWTDGLAGAFAVAALFLMVAIVFSQTSFARHEQISLNAFESPVVEEGEQLENVSRLRAEIDRRDRSFTICVLTGASVPMSIFVCSMFRLFTKTADD